MRVSARTSQMILLVGLCLLLAVVFRSFILEYLAVPIALVLWVFWRFLQSIDQTTVWILLILLALLVGIIRLLRLLERKLTIWEPTSQFVSSAVLERIHYWRESIRFALPRTTGPHTVEHHLGKMLAELYASQQPNAAYYEVYTALKEHQLPLPRPINAFLFPPEPPASEHPIKRILLAIRDMPRKQIYRWTGREVADYYRSLDEVLTFMESSLERKP